HGPNNSGTEYRSCTFWGNHAATGSVLSYRHKYSATTDALEHCLLAGNTGGDPVETSGGLGPAARCTDIHGNDGRQWYDPFAYFPLYWNNLCAEPLLRDPAHGDFRVAAGSPCAPEHNLGCGLIGAGAVAGPAAPRRFRQVLQPVIQPVEGFAWGDADGDGDPDLDLSSEMIWSLDMIARDDLPYLLRNDGGWLLPDVSPDTWPRAAPPGGAAAWADLDADGDLDLVRLAGLSDDAADEVWENQDGLMVRQLATAWCPGVGQALAPADWNGDGRLDLLLAARASGAGAGGVRLLANAGGWTFADATQPEFAPTVGVATDLAWSDVDADGDLDFVLAFAGEPDRLFLQQAGGVFVAAALPAGDADSTFAVAWLDADNDGAVDLFRARGTAGARLDRGDGAGGFTDVTSPGWSGVPCTWGAWADADNDGDLDVLLGSATGAVLWLGNGAGGFAALADTVLAGLKDVSLAAWLDGDGDGHMDVCVAGARGLQVLAGGLAIGSTWLSVLPVTGEPAVAAVGARVTVWLDGARQQRVYGLGSSGQVQVLDPVHFGCGAAAAVDSVRVTWPDGVAEVWRDVPTGAVLTARRGQPSAVPGAPAEAFALHPARPNPFNPRTEVSFTLERAAAVSLVVHDAAGRVVRTLAAGPRTAGPHTVAWEGTDGAGRAVPSGVYFVLLRAGGREEARKVTLLR
ncbi:MAG: FG-GAP-like repeat-containing protein, partial [Candidatus Krumholzibacteriia bacterium]